MDERTDELAHELGQTFRNHDDALQWLNSAVPAFGGATPRSLIDAGRGNEVVALLRALNLGLPN
jgi:uncharacterized protein (DUF2384 family)